MGSIFEFFYDIVVGIINLVVGLIEIVVSLIWWALGSWIFWAVVVLFIIIPDGLNEVEITEGVARVEGVECVDGADRCVIDTEVSILVTINATDIERLRNTKYVKLGGDVVQEEPEEDGEDEITLTQGESSMTLILGDSTYEIAW